MLATRGSKIYFKAKIHKNLWLHQTVVTLKIKSGHKFMNKIVIRSNHIRNFHTKKKKKKKKNKLKEN